MSLIASQVWSLRNVDLLKNLGEEDLLLLQERARVVRFAKGDHVCMSGMSNSVAYIVKEGTVRMMATMPNGKRLTVSILQPGEIVGEIEAMEVSQPGESAEAMDDCVLYAVPVDLLTHWVAMRPEMALSVLKVAGQRRVQLLNRLQDVLFLTVPDRLCRLFLRLSDQFPGVTKSGRRFINLRLTHAEIADLIGANREAVSAAVARMRKDGLIDTIQGRVVLVAEDALRSQALAHGFAA